MDVLVIGDGPGGLSAALFLAKAGKAVTVVGPDESAMHWARLYNYLGIDMIDGSTFQERSRAQVQKLGATLLDGRVEAVENTGEGFVATLASGDTLTAPTLILSEGKSPKLARSLGCAEGDNGITVDAHGLTSVPGVFAVGRMVWPTRSQAIISAGDGAKAALHILAQLEGRDVQDWDSPPKE